jgi:predicted nuclease of predicted toxin-antitoxin system
LRFIVDAQLPPALARAIAGEGHDPVHVNDIDLTSASDHAVWAEAAQRHAAIITKDEDFILIGRGREETSVPAIVWLRIGNCTKKALLEAFLSVFPWVVEMLEAGEKMIEIR